MIDVATKVCRKCQTGKPLTEFGKKSSSSDGLNARCRPCVKVDKAESWSRNGESNRAKLKARYQANREAHIAAVAAWKKANPDKVSQYGRTYRERNPERDLQDTRRWIANNPERAAENFRRNAMKRRARKKGVEVGKIDLDALWERQGGHCGLCGDPINRELRYPNPLSKSVDHIVPLAKGGAHEQGNLQWAHLVCNNRKGARAPHDPAAGFSAPN